MVGVCVWGGGATKVMINLHFSLLSCLVPLSLCLSLNSLLHYIKVKGTITSLKNYIIPSTKAHTSKSERVLRTKALRNQF